MTLKSTIDNYFGEGIVDTQFIQDNLELMKQWANGSKEAMEELERKVLDVFAAMNGLDLNQMITNMEGLTQSAGEALNEWANGLQYGQ